MGSKNKCHYKLFIQFSNQENAHKVTSLWYKDIKNELTFTILCDRNHDKEKKAVIKRNVSVTGKVQSRHVL